MSILLLFQLNFVFANTTIPPIIPASSEQIKIPHSTTTTSGSVSFLQENLLPGITAFIITITAAVAILMVIYGGILMLTSYANPENFKKGIQSVTWAIIGIIIGGLSYAIIKIIAAIKL